MNQRHFLFGTLSAAALLGSGGTALARHTVWNPCRAHLPPDIANHDIVRSDWQGLDPTKVWDCHAHLAGIGDGASGIEMNPRMLSPLHPAEYRQRLFYLNAGCAHEAPGRVDQSSVERLHNLCDGMAPGFKLLLFAFERTHNSSGQPRPELTAFHVDPRPTPATWRTPIRRTSNGPARSTPTGRIASRPSKPPPAMAHAP